MKSIVFFLLCASWMESTSAEDESRATTGEYKFYNNGPGCGKESIKSSSECGIAAAALGYSKDALVVNDGNAPPGCLVGHPNDGWKHSFFNKHPTGTTGKNVYRSLCHLPKGDKGEYKFYNNGPGCGKESIKSSSECGIAAAALGYSKDALVVNDGNAPPGCLVGHPNDGWKHSFFNKHPTGTTGKNVYRSLCHLPKEPAIAYKLTDGYDMIWKDKWSGGKYEVSIWRPKNYQSDFCFLGDVATNDEDYKPPSQPAIVVSAIKSGALVHPTSFTRVWKDSGSGASLDGAVYKMNAPAGYTCLGGVAMKSHSDQPDKKKYCCVKNDYIVSGDFEFVYNDKRTGASAALSLWKVKRGMDVYGLDAGNFVPVNGYGQPSHGYLLKADEVTVKAAWTIEAHNIKPLKLFEARELKEIWNDDGSWARSDLSIWRTEAKKGYFRLGDMAVNSYSKPKYGFLLKLSNPKDNDAVKAPISYSKIWNSKGSGAKKGGVTIWKVNCPGGYVALGNVATVGKQPKKPALWSIACVNSKYVERGYNNGNTWKKIWTDHRSGASSDVSIYEAKGARTTQQTVRGIGAIANWDDYPGTPYLLKKSELTYSSEKPIERIELSHVQYNLKAKKKLPSTPQSLNSITVINTGPTEQTSSKTISYSASETRSFTFSQSIELGVSLLVKAGIPLIGGAETTISVKATSTFSTGKSTTTTKTKTVTAILKTPGNSKITATIIGKRYTVDIPYTAHIKKIYYDGTQWKGSVTGIYHGVSVSEVEVTIGKPEKI